jgi:hypothetical protein
MDHETDRLVYRIPHVQAPPRRPAQEDARMTAFEFTLLAVALPAAAVIALGMAVGRRLARNARAADDSGDEDHAQHLYDGCSSWRITRDRDGFRTADRDLHLVLSPVRPGRVHRVDVPRRRSTHPGV